MEIFKIANSWMISVTVYGTVIIILALVLVNRTAISRFIGEVRVELSKCTWPWDPEQTGLRKYKELVDSTVVVSVVSLLLAAYVSSFDFLLGRLVGLVVRF